MNTLGTNFKVFIDRDRMFGDTFAVRMGSQMRDGRWAVMLPTQMEVLPSDDAVETRPAFTLTKDDAQAFMDELWHVGIRPTEGTGSAGSLAATQAHLKDMRALVAKANKVELK